MKSLVMFVVAALAVASSQALSLAEARGKTDAVIATPSEMTAVMKQLSADDQKGFVASVNKAMVKMPGSVEEKSAKVLNVDRAALRGAAKGNVTALLAEIFATAPVESLVVISEILAKDVLNRSANPSKTYTDEQFTEISKKVMTAVLDRVAGSDDAGVRSGFAAITMVRASNGSPASLADTLADMMGDSAKIAKTEWFPAALGPDKNFDLMLAATSAEKAPDVRTALRIAGPQRHELLLFALFTGDEDYLRELTDGFGDWSWVETSDQGLYTIPRTLDPNDKAYPGYERGSSEDVPRPYDGQNPGI